MEAEKTLELTIETQAIGDVIMDIPYNQSENMDGFVVSIPNRKFFGTDYTNLDLTYVVNRDIELFKILNARSDRNHQIYIDTLCIYGIQIRGSYIRIKYWFNQDRNPDVHRECAGVLTHLVSRGNYLHNKDEITKVFPEAYSADVCVYW